MCCITGFIKYDNVNSEYINSSNIKENLRDILKYMSSFLAATDRTINLRLMLNHFCEFYQQIRPKKYLGFNKKEIQKLLDKYFFFDFAEGFYQGWDSYLDVKDDIVFYDKNG